MKLIKNVQLLAIITDYYRDLLKKQNINFNRFGEHGDKAKAMCYVLGWDSLSLLWRELVDSEFRLSVLGTEESSEVSCVSTSSGVTGHSVLRLCLTASQPNCFSTSQPCLVLVITPSTYTHVLWTPSDSQNTKYCSMKFKKKTHTKKKTVWRYMFHSNAFKCNWIKDKERKAHPRTDSTSQCWANARISGMTFSSCRRFRPQFEEPMLPWKNKKTKRKTTTIKPMSLYYH